LQPLQLPGRLRHRPAAVRDGRPPQPRLRHSDPGGLPLPQQEWQSVQFFLWHAVLIPLQLQFHPQNRPMKKFLHAILGLGAFGTAALYVSAEPALNVVVVDMAKVYDNDWKTQDEMTKLTGSRTSAQQQFDQMTKDGQALMDQYKSLDEKAKNPLT